MDFNQLVRRAVDKNSIIIKKEVEVVIEVVIDVVAVVVVTVVIDVEDVAVEDLIAVAQEVYLSTRLLDFNRIKIEILTKEVKTSPENDRLVEETTIESLEDSLRTFLITMSVLNPSHNPSTIGNRQLQPKRKTKTPVQDGVILDPKILILTKPKRKENGLV
jgi:hypothetical protein